VPAISRALSGDAVAGAIKSGAQPGETRREGEGKPADNAMPTITTSSKEQGRVLRREAGNEELGGKAVIF